MEEGQAVKQLASLATLEFVYERMICEFTHWDICLTGLIELDGQKVFCEVKDPYAKDVQYDLRRVSWDDECDEYLEDYRVAYTHWFHEGGKRPVSYGGWDLGWFSDKWKHRNPIAENAEKRAKL